MMTVGSLFSGIGGLDLGLERAGFRILWQAETNAFASAVLRKHWPDVPNLGDIRLIDWNEVPRVNLLVGGFPCQPVSLAGKRKAQADERWLWPEFGRAIRVLRPRYVLIENVPGILVRGGTDVLRDLAACGYDAEWETIPAGSFGAPHIRARVFIVAYCLGTNDRPDSAFTKNGQVQQPGIRACKADVANSNEQYADGCGYGAGKVFRQWGPTSELCQCQSTTDCPCPGFPIIKGQCTTAKSSGGPEPDPANWWAFEPCVDRVADGVPNRVGRLRCLGNAVVPQVAEAIGRAIIMASGAAGNHPNG